MKTGSTGSSTTCKREHSEFLLVAPNWLGDAVMVTPLLAVLARRSPGTRVTVACRSYVGSIFRSSAAARIEYPSDGVRDRMAAVREGRPPGGWDVCLVAPPSFSAALVSVASGARRRIGYAGGWRRALLTDALPAADYRRRHLSAAYLRLLEPLAGETFDDPPAPAVVAPDGWRDEARRSCGDAPYCVLAPGATYGPAKAWPRAHYAELARRLSADEKLAVVVVGSAAERSYADALIAESGVQGLNRSGELALDELLAALRGASLVVGNDSGPVHLAAALGVPTVAIFGPTSVAWTAPRGRAVRIVSAGVACAPCFRRECPLGTMECLERVSVDMVRAAVRSLGEGETG